MSQDNKVYFTPEGCPVMPNKFDARIRRRSLTRGLLSAAELKKHYDSLPDETSHCEFRDYDALIRDDGTEGAALSGPAGSGTTTH